jgi:hypothetical protein
MTLKEIDDKILELKQRRHELEKLERKEFQKNAQKNVGRCFKINGCKYAKVIDVPQEQWTRTHYIFNEYQYPALFLTNDTIPFEEDTLFSGAWGVGNNDPWTTYEEITQEEFAKEFETRVQKLREKFL